MKNYNGYYYVNSPDGQVTACKIRGRLKKTRFSLLTGDYVIFEPAVNGEGSIEEILPRKNSLLRPAVANVDQLILVFAAKQPDFNRNTFDRFLVLAEQSGIPIIICLSKADLLEKSDDIENIKNIYQNIGYRALVLSSLSGEGTEELKKLLHDKISVFAGLSGVGKSSLLNFLYPTLELSTGEVSEKIGRGKHTTRYSELLAVDGAYIVDTPGFSLSEVGNFSGREIENSFPEFKEYKTYCKFSTCLHASEPLCAVKEAVRQGKIDNIRYQHYLEILAETDKGRRI